MSDGTEAPVGEGDGLPPDVQAHKARMEDPAWKARLLELEQDVHATIGALFAHCEGAAAVSIPIQLDNGTIRAVVAGDPIALFAALQGEGPRLLMNKHVIVGALNPKEMLLGALMQLIRGKGPGDEDEDDEECDCPACVAARANPH